MHGDYICTISAPLLPPASLIQPLLCPPALWNSGPLLYSLCVRVCHLRDPSSIVHVCVFRVDHLGLDNPSGPFLWGKLILLKRLLIVCRSSSMSVALWSVPHPRQHVNWCYCVNLIYHMAEVSWVQLLELKDPRSQQASWSFGSHNLLF